MRYHIDQIDLATLQKLDILLKHQLIMQGEVRDFLEAYEKPPDDSPSEQYDPAQED
jgi:hypothetical protein